MNHNELIQYIAVDAGVTQIDVRNALQSLAKAIKLTLRKNGNVNLNNIGVLKIKTTPARIMRNPRTQALINVPAKRHMRLTVSGTIKKAIN